MQLLHQVYDTPILWPTSLTAKASRFLARIAGFKSGTAASRMESPIAGQAWTDTAERELNNDIAICRFNRW